MSQLSHANRPDWYECSADRATSVRASWEISRKRGHYMRRVVLIIVMGLMGSFLAVGPSAAATRPRVQVPTVSCGAPVPKPGGGTWVCTFADEFNGTSLDRTKWLPQVNQVTGSGVTRSCWMDNPNNVAVGGGMLQLTVRRLALPIWCYGSLSWYTSGSVSTYRKFSQQYGRFEARFKNAATTKPGLQEAFWLWPDDRVPSWTIWPAAGEIDVVETYSQYFYLAIPYLHYTANNNGGPIPGVTTAWNCLAARGVYNTYALTWTPTSLTIDVNGKTCLVNKSGDPAFKKAYIAAFTATVGLDSNVVRWNTPMPATMSVDYLRVWR